MTAKLEAQWIVGFVDGEGCFNLDVHVKVAMRWGVQIQPEFTVVQHEVDIQVLHALKAHFGCGSVGVNRKDNTSTFPGWEKSPKLRLGTRMHYRCKSVKDLHEKIIPFFEQHQLKTKKQVEFQRFRDIVRLMYDDYHNQSLKNFLEIIEKGENLRVRSMPSKKTKRAKFDEIIEQLRKRSAAYPSL